MNSVLSNVRYSIQNITTIDTKSFSHYLAGLARWNMQGEITNLLHQRSLSAGRFEEREKVIKVIDSLLKVDSFRFMIYNVVIDIFVRFFILAHGQNNLLEIQALKMIRKTWIKYLPVNYPSIIRQLIKNAIGIDIEEE